MPDFTIDASQLKRLNKSLTKAGRDYKKGAKRLLKEIGNAVLGLARKYAPESPTKAMYASMNKSGVTKRKTSSITTGSLRDSITSDLGKDYVSIGVPVNSRAGDYAEKIHEEKGKSWHKRGPRTKQKGKDADEKYIYRAYDDTPVDELVDKVIDDLTRGIGV